MCIKFIHQIDSRHLFITIQFQSHSISIFIIVLFVIYIQIVIHLFIPIQFQSHLISIFIIFLLLGIVLISIINTIIFIIAVIIIIIIINNNNNNTYGRYQGIFLLDKEEILFESFDSLSSS